MIWLLFALLFLFIIWGIGTMKARGDRARNVLNRDGWPRPFDRADHRRNDEE